MKAEEQAEWMIEKHGDNSLKEHKQIMKDICSIYYDDEDRAKKESLNYNHLVEVKENIIMIMGCQCESPDIFTDENGLNFCKECKIETEIFRKPSE
jgi:hypothetical protein